MRCGVIDLRYISEDPWLVKDAKGGQSEGEGPERSTSAYWVSIYISLPARYSHMLPPVHFEMTLKSGYYQRPEISCGLPKSLYMVGK